MSFEFNDEYIFPLIDHEKTIITKLPKEIRSDKISNKDKSPEFISGTFKDLQNLNNKSTNEIGPKDQIFNNNNNNNNNLFYENQNKKIHHLLVLVLNQYNH